MIVKKYKLKVEVISGVFVCFHSKMLLSIKYKLYKKLPKTCRNFLFLPLTFFINKYGESKLVLHLQ